MTRTGEGVSGGRGARQDITRRINSEAVLSLLRTDGPLSRAALSRQVGLAKATVSSVVEELIAAGVVHESGQGASAPAGGRPPRLLSVDPSSRHLVGVAIGARTTTVVVTDALGDTLARCSATTPGGPPRSTIGAAAGLIHDLLHEAGAQDSSVAAVGVVVPGIVDPTTSVCLLAPNLGWHDVAVADLLGHEFSAPIFVHNTAQAVVVAEAEDGAARGYDDVVCVYASTGVGAGMLRGGRVVLGGAGVAGELGHCTVPGATETCNCGKVGCLETVASGPAIERAAARALAAGRRSTLGELSRPVTTRDVAAAAATGDRLALTLIEQAAEILGTATSWLVNIVNPGIVIVTGGLADVGPLLLEPMEAAMRRDALPQAVRGLSLRPAALGADAPIRGAVLLARQYADDHFRTVFRSNA
jgi:glucokinase-like ROK family protein